MGTDKWNRYRSSCRPTIQLTAAAGKVDYELSFCRVQREWEFMLFSKEKLLTFVVSLLIKTTCMYLQSSEKVLDIWPHFCHCKCLKQAGKHQSKLLTCLVICIRSLLNQSYVLIWELRNSFFSIAFCSTKQQLLYSLLAIEETTSTVDLLKVWELAP